MVNLYDHFKIKGNMYLSPKDLVSLITTLYSSLSSKKNVFFLSNSRRKELETFRSALDITFGYITPDCLRKQFVNNIHNNDMYMLPNDKIILSEIDRVLGLGLGSSAIANIRRLDSIFSKFKDLKESYKLDNLND